jgi:hypothetical protein
MCTPPSHSGPFLGGHFLTESLRILNPSGAIYVFQSWVSSLSGVKCGHLPSSGSLLGPGIRLYYVHYRHRLLPARPLL